MRFSVIIPLFNKSSYVNKALESVLSQSFKEFELIVVDDGSTDDSYSMARTILEKGVVSYKLIHQENKGVSCARNNGVKLSCGEYLCFLDADDWWSPTFLEKMDKLIHDYPEAGIYGTNYYYVKNGRKRVCVTTTQTGYINYCRCYSEKLQMPLWTGAISVSRVVFDEMGGFRPHLRLGEDFDLWIKIALKYKVAFLDDPLSYYYQDSNASWRLTGRLHPPESHMLWNLEYLAEEEETNKDYKQLIDNLRTYSLFPYYLSRRYRGSAKKELAKVDWDQQPERVRRLYLMPLPLLQFRRIILQYGSKIKRLIVRYL